MRRRDGSSAPRLSRLIIAGRPFEHVGQPDLGVVAVEFGAIAHPLAENPMQFRLPLPTTL